MQNYSGCVKVFLITIMALVVENPGAEEVAESIGRVYSKEDIIRYSREKNVVEKTEGKMSAEQHKMFEENLHKLVRIKQDKVLFMCKEQQYGHKKRFGIGTDNGWTCDFIIGVNDKFRGPLDEHGSIKYQVINIGDDSVTIRYESKFDHASFGKNKVTIDTGAVEINYRE